jgi:hypothetical protein
MGLTLSYALYQSNVGTAYRHRAQLYVFFIIFISVGLELRREAKQKRRAQMAVSRPAFASFATASNGPLASSSIHSEPDLN